MVMAVTRISNTCAFRLQLAIRKPYLPGTQVDTAMCVCTSTKRDSTASCDCRKISRLYDWLHMLAGSVGRNKGHFAQELGVGSFVCIVVAARCQETAMPLADSFAAG